MLRMTGGCEFIGRNLIEHLHKCGVKIRVDRATVPTWHLFSGDG